MWIVCSFIWATDAVILLWLQKSNKHFQGTSPKLKQDNWITPHGASVFSLLIMEGASGDCSGVTFSTVPIWSWDESHPKL